MASMNKSCGSCVGDGITGVGVAAGSGEASGPVPAGRGRRGINSSHDLSWSYRSETLIASAVN